MQYNLFITFLIFFYLIYSYKYELYFKSKKIDRSLKIDFFNNFLVKKFYYEMKVSGVLNVFPLSNYYYWRDNSYITVNITSDITEYNKRIGFIVLKDVLVLSDGFISNNVAFTIKGHCNHKAFNKYNFNYSKNHYSTIKNGIALTTSFSNATFHSIVEGLSKFMPFYFNRSLLSQYKLILSVSPESLHPAASILKLLYNSENSIIELPVIVRNLIIPVPGTCGFGMKENMVKMNIAITQKIIKENSHKQEKILILKRNRNRIIRNFNETLEIIKLIFKNNNLLIFDDSIQYNYKDILLMFYESNIVIGVHGAGLSNILACRKGTKILEITTSKINGCFEGLSKQLDLKFYRYILDKSMSDTYRFMTLNINTTDFHNFLYYTFFNT